MVHTPVKEMQKNWYKEKNSRFLQRYFIRFYPQKLQIAKQKKICMEIYIEKFCHLFSIRKHERDLAARKFFLFMSFEMQNLPGHFFFCCVLKPTVVDGQTENLIFYHSNGWMQFWHKGTCDYQNIKQKAVEAETKDWVRACH